MLFLDEQPQGGCQAAAASAQLGIELRRERLLLWHGRGYGRSLQNAQQETDRRVGLQSLGSRAVRPATCDGGRQGCKASCNLTGGWPDSSSSCAASIGVGSGSGRRSPERQKTHLQTWRRKAADWRLCCRPKGENLLLERRANHGAEGPGLGDGALLVLEVAAASYADRGKSGEDLCLSEMWRTEIPPRPKARVRHDLSIP